MGYDQYDHVELVNIICVMDMLLEWNTIHGYQPAEMGCGYSWDLTEKNSGLKGNIRGIYTGSWKTPGLNEDDYNGEIIVN